ncbi:MAG: DNA polymerase III subunit delta' [Thermodesulfobacteriota bacterium]
MATPVQPHLLSSVIGQERAKTVLRRAVAGQRLGHAFLFRGPAGVGKRRTAMAFAALVNCRQRRAGDACGVCPSCRKLAAGSHPDVTRIDPDGAFIKIDQIRRLATILGFPPLEGLFRVIILAGVENMRVEGANALLKTLEEPPPATILVLTADEAGPLLPTVVSRCQVVPFLPLAPEEVAQGVLLQVDCDPHTARGMAAVAGGSIGRALTLAASGLHPTSERLQSVLAAGWADDPETVEALLALAREAAALKEDLDPFLDLVAIWARDLLVTATGLPASLLANPDAAARLSSVQGRWTREEIQAMFRDLDRVRDQLRRNCNRELACEVLFLGLAPRRPPATGAGGARPSL